MVKALIEPSFLLKLIFLLFSISGFPHFYSLQFSQCKIFAAFLQYFKEHFGIRVPLLIYPVAYAVPYAVANDFLELSIGVFSCSPIWRLGRKAFSVLFLQISTPFNLIKTLCCMETIHYSILQIGPAGHQHRAV